MTHEEAIAVLQSRLDNITEQIGERQTELSESTDPDEEAVLSAEISELQETQEALETALNNMRITAPPMTMAGGPSNP